MPRFFFLICFALDGLGLRRSDKVVDLGSWNAYRVLIDRTHRELLQNLGFEFSPDLSDRALLAQVCKEPVLLQKLAARHAAIWVHIEHFFKDVEAVVGEIATDHLESTAIDLPIELVVSLALERKEAI